MATLAEHFCEIAPRTLKPDEPSGERTPTVAATATATPTATAPHPLVEEFGCQWIMDTYRPAAQLGRDLAIQHLANSMMLKRSEPGDSFSSIGTGDAAPALWECEA